MAPPPLPLHEVFFCAKNSNSGTRRRIEIFQKRKMFRIEFPEILAWFQTPQTVSRPSRPNFQPHRTNSGTRRPFEIFKKRKMFRIEFPKFLAWFQTPQTVSRPSIPIPARNVYISNYIWGIARLEIGSGRSGNGLRCLEPGQNFRKFNSDHFPFFKNLNPTSGSRVSLPAQKNTS